MNYGRRTLMASWNLDNRVWWASFCAWWNPDESVYSFPAKTDAIRVVHMFGRRRREEGSASTETTWLQVLPLVWWGDRLFYTLSESWNEPHAKFTKTLLVRQWQHHYFNRHCSTIAVHQLAHCTQAFIGFLGPLNPRKPWLLPLVGPCVFQVWLSSAYLETFPISARRIATFPLPRKVSQCITSEVVFTLHMPPLLLPWIPRSAFAGAWLKSGEVKRKWVGAAIP